MTETISCPECQQPVYVPDSILGQMVQCPECQKTFRAPMKDSAVHAGPALATSGAVTSSRPPAIVDDEDERPRRRRYDDEDEELDLPRRRRPLEPHRASTIMTLGILSIFIVPLVLGSIAWVMGNADLKKMDDGIMDPSGRGQTNTGRTIGKIMVILHIVMIFVSIVLTAVLMSSVLVFN